MIESCEMHFPSVLTFFSQKWSILGSKANIVCHGNWSVRTFLHDPIYLYLKVSGDHNNIG